MRFGFVAASLLAHLGVVGLAFYTTIKAPAPGITEVRRESGVVSVELEAPDTTFSDFVDEPGEARTGGAQELPPTEPVALPKQAATVADVQSAATPAPKTQRSKFVPKPRPRVEPKSETPNSRAPASQADDWLSIEQQLPEPAPAEPSKAASRPERDELVERLLAKERDRSRVKQREEFERAEVARADEGRPPVASVQQVTNQSAGQSYASADVWIELTRWLPRAASGDQAWEAMAVDTRLDVEVNVRAVRGAALMLEAVGKVPEAVQRLLDTTAHLMQRGRFATDGPVFQRFSLRIRLSQTAERELWIAHTTPDPPKPGVGSFVAPSGRRFDVWVAAEP